MIKNSKSKCAHETINSLYILSLYVGVFNESTARALMYYSIIYPSFAGTANFVSSINNLRKVMSLRLLSKGKCIYWFCNELLV